jgi:TolB-like protein
LKKLGGAALIYCFGPFRLDTGQFELRRGGEAVHVEPLVFDLLALFAANPGAVIDRDRLLAEIWEGRFVSDATLSTAVKSARRALGDSGEAQSYIETVRGRGFRFRAEVAIERLPEARAAAPDDAPGPAGSEPLRGAPSIAVLPFERVGDRDPFAGLEDAVPHEVIFALARLRWLFVIARGSSFRFRGPDVDIAAVGRALGVRYALTGTLEVFGRSLAVAVELAETATGRVLWGERFRGSLDDVHAVRGEIVGGITTALETRIQVNEAILAQGSDPENLDAWQAFHLGLRHMHLYTREGNAAADGLFRRAVALEPGFGRAHAGLSFVHFQNAFLRYVPDRNAEIVAARARAEKGLELDPLDPFVNLNMGRSFWLRQELENALPWLERATAISPNYAQGVYSRAIMDTFLGRTASGLHNADLAMELSPLDPLLYAMRATKALGRVTEGDFAEAARWGETAAHTPGAHVIIAMIAMATHALAGDEAMARQWAERVRAIKPDANRRWFFESLPIQHAESRALFETALDRCGF